MRQTWGGSKKPSLHAMKKRVQAIIKKRIMLGLLNICKKNKNIVQEQDIRSIEGLDGKAEVEIKSSFEI